MSTCTEAARAIDAWLAECGWKQDGPRPGQWRRPTPSGKATLSCRPVSSGWESWYVQGGGVPAVPAAGLLQGNARLPGPFKLVPGPRGSAVCRADLPAEVSRGPLDVDPFREFPASGHPLRSWARALTALAAGGDPEPAPAGPAPSELAAVLVKGGWSATAADGVVRVSVALPGLFRQVTVEQRASGTRLWCELTDLAGRAPECREAALALAGAANTRLRLVRLALPERPGAEPLLAEIDLASARIPGAWLEVGLEAVQTAIALTARELSALRDPGLANWYRAATAAAGEGGCAS